MDHLACARCGARNAEFDPRCSRCGEALPQVSASSPTTAPGPEDPLLGKCLGAYRLLEPLGRGGMGQVYRARHLGSGRFVAIKTVSVPTAGMLDGLRREVRALSRLRHPGIVRILEQGVEDGLPWYAMQLLRGSTLRASSRWQAAGAEMAGETWWTRSLTAGPRSGTPTGGPEQPGRPVILAQHAAPLHEMLTLMRRLCAALAYLHGEGLVHGDLKPENILVVGNRNRGARSPLWPVIVDFGLSSAFAGARGREALDVGGGAAGTAAYMAPEQILGEPLDARADLYSLGCILYELVTGRRPFSGRSVREVLEGHLHGVPAPPSQVVPGLPAGVDRLVLRLLAKQPRERLGHADDVGTALAELGADDAPTPRAPRPRAYLYRPALAGRHEPLARLEQQIERLGQDAGSGGLTLVGGESGVGKTRLLVELSRRAAGRGIQVLSGECLPGVARSELRGASEQQSGSSSGVPRAPVAVSGAESARASRGRSNRSPFLPAGASGPLEALRKPLQAVADRCRERGPAETERLLGRRGKVLAQYEPVLRGLPGQEAYPEPADLPADAARLRLFAYLAETFEALAGAPSRLRMPLAPVEAGEGSSDRAAPMLLILDDLQWADELTLGFLDYWLRVRTLGSKRLGETHPAGTPNAAASPMNVVGTYRSEEVDTGPGEAGAAHASLLRRLIDASGVEKVYLGRLEEEAVGTIVGDMLALEPPPALFVRHMARHSEGNPFFVAEYLRAAIDQGLLYRDGRGQWQVAKPVGVQHAAPDAAATEAAYEGLGLPKSLQELVRSRLRGLGTGARKLLQAAAVLGRETGLEVLGHMVRMDQDRLLDALQELLRRQVLEVPAPGRLRFVHDKIREAAYFALRKQQLKRLHRAAAEAIGSIHAGALEDHRAALGRHWEAAGEPDQARPHHLAAARTAAKRYDHAEAERLYRAYLRLVEEPTAESITARNELGERVLDVRGRMSVALEESQKALKEARGLGDRVLEIHSLSLISQIQHNAGHAQEAVASCGQALTIACEIGERRIEGKLLGHLGHMHLDQGQMDQARVSLEQGLAILREVGPRDIEARLLDHLGNLHRETGHLEEAQRLMEQALSIAHEIGERRNEAMFLGNLGILHTVQGQSVEAQTLLEQALAIDREMSDRRLEGNTLNGLANLYFEQGRLEESRTLCEQALSIAQEIGARRLEGIVILNLANVYKEKGQKEEARTLLEQALTISREVIHLRNVAAVLTNLGNLHLEQGRLEEARTLYEEALAIAHDTGNHGQEGTVLGSLACLYQEQGRLEEARTLYERALAIHRELGNQRDEANVLNNLAGLHQERGRLEEARTLYEQALAISRELDNRILQGLALGGLARLWLLQGAAAKADALASESEALVQAMGVKEILCAVLCTRGHIALVQGRSGRALLQRAEALAEELGSGPQSETSRIVAKLRRAIETFEAGEHHRLFRGELLEDLPEGLRRRLAADAGS